MSVEPLLFVIFGATGDLSRRKLYLLYTTLRSRVYSTARSSWERRERLE